MASLKGAAAEYALTRDAQGKVFANRPGSRVVIPFNDQQRITAVRKSIEKKGEGWTWRGEVEGTGEPVMLMWWKGGKFTGLFTYRGRIYTLRNMGGDIHAIVETDPDKLPPDHGPVASQEGRAADLKDDPLVARGEGAAMRPAVAQDGRASFSEAIISMVKGLSPTKIVPLSAAKRRQLLANKVTIDVMIFTPRRSQKNTSILIPISSRFPSSRPTTLLPAAASAMWRCAWCTIRRSNTTKARASTSNIFTPWSMATDQLRIHKLRDRKGADVVVLIVDDASGCGLSTRVAAEAGEAFAVVHHTCAALTYSIAHEIGHIIGARHDKALDPNTLPFPYGHGYVNGNKWRDIMSYRQSCSGCPRIPYWSNPTIKIRGEAGGAVDADNARVILEQAERVAKFR